MARINFERGPLRIILNYYLLKDFKNSMENTDNLEHTLNNFVKSTIENLNILKEVLSNRRGFACYLFSPFFHFLALPSPIDEHREQSLEITAQKIKSLQSHLNFIQGYLTQEENTMMHIQVYYLFINGYRIRCSKTFHLYFILY